VTTRLDLKEFLSAYLAEAGEQLETANKALLELEALTRRNEANPRLVRDLFRALHTIKGLSAMVGVEPAVAIAHRLESILRAFDDRGGILPIDSFDLLFKAVRAIEVRVTELAEGRDATPAQPDLLAALDRLEAAKGGLRSSLLLDASIVSKLATFEREALERCGEKGLRAVRIDFSPSPEKAKRGLSINTVRERLSPLADVVKVVPVSVPPSATAPGALTFALLLTTSASDDELAAAVGTDHASVHLLLEVERPVAEELLAPRAPEEAQEIVSTQTNVVRVDVSRLDDAMECLSSLIVTRSRLTRAIGDLASRGVGTRDLQEVLRDNGRQLRDLRSAILRVRMVRVAEVFERLPLILRGIERDGAKVVSLVLEAGDAELDKAVAERLFPALVHLVRNAVDHAIESQEERVALGKPPAGMVRIVCSAESSTRLELKVIDDGRGIDRAELARRVGGVVPETFDALLDILCRPGLSTRTSATTTSGRGMGMDIVRRTVVGQLGGDLSLTTEPHVGTTFTLRIPLTVMIVDAFALDCAGQRFVVPVSMVEEVLEVDRARVSYGPSATGRREDAMGIIEQRGEAIPFIPLASAFHIAGAYPYPKQALLARRAGQAVAFGVDRVVTQLEAVVRPLVDPLVVAPGIGGATDLGDGRPTLVLDLLALTAAALPAGRRAA
jgi:two-component system, chemotaxis family, sensor kinase CheA